MTSIVIHVCLIRVNLRLITALDRSYTTSQSVLNSIRCTGHARQRAMLDRKHPSNPAQLTILCVGSSMSVTNGWAEEMETCTLYRPKKIDIQPLHKAMPI